MKKERGHDYSTLLIWAAAVVSVVRYSAAFIASDVGKIEGPLSEWITFLLGISGLGMGILDTIGATYLFDGWRRVMPKAGDKWGFRFRILTFFVFALFITGIIILAPFTMSRVAHVSILDILGDGFWLGLWSTLVNAAPALLIGGVATGQQVVTVTQTESTQKGGNLPENLPTRGPTNWRQVRKQLSQEDVTWLSKARTEEICFRYGIDDRTARNWRKYAQEGKQ